MAWRLTKILIVLAWLVVGVGSRAQAQGTDELVSLRTQVSQLYTQGKYAEAAPIAERYVALARKKHGEEHEQFASAIYWLATIYQAQARNSQAEPLFKRALAIREKVLGPNHPDVGNSLNNLGLLYKAQGRYAEAEPLYKRALAITEKALGPDHLDVATPLNNLAALYDALGHSAEAEPLYKRALVIREKALDPDDLLVAISLNNLATFYLNQGHYAVSEPLLKRSLAIREKALGPDSPVVAHALMSLAALYRNQGRYAEAEPLLKGALTIREKALGPEHPDMRDPLVNLAELYRIQGRYSDAESLLKRALVVTEKALGSSHEDVGVMLNNLAWVYSAQGRATEAESLYQRALAIAELALGPTHPNIPTHLHNLAALYRTQGRVAEAEDMLKRALAIAEKAAPDHPNTAKALINLAELYREQARYAEAEPLSKQALAIAEKALGPDHPDVATALNNLAMLAIAQRDWVQAAGYWLRATEVIERRAERGLAGSEGSSIKGEAVRLSWYFSGLVKMTDRLAPQGHADRARQAWEMFETAQWAQGSDAASSLTQMAARSAKGDTALAGLVRERQDLVGEWQVKDKQLIAAKSQLPGKRSPDAEKVLSDRLAAIDGRLRAIDAQFTKDFPEYASFTSPKPASVAEVQALVQPNEALVLFLDTDERFKPTPEETFIWVVTKTNARWVRSEIGTAALSREVAALRCGLDYQGAWAVAGSQCAQLLNTTYSEIDHRLGKALPFDPARAHALYKALFGEIEDLIESKRLLVVPSGPLTQLPFHVLVTAKPETVTPNLSDYRKIAWFARSHAITVLPAVSSLKALRQHATPSQTTKPFLGIGNPLLDGPDDSYADLKQAAMDRKSCGGLGPIRVAEIQRGSGVKPFAQRGGIAEVADLRLAPPLPETADELCDVAKAVGATEADILLGARASEGEIKRLSEAGTLRSYRIVHFATHGALAGEISMSAEPGLLLTPPKTGTEADDGYLSASEIASLKLDADWVVLSACNTAAAEAKGAEALSGLARAFFYAGARALLVSHWAVDSEATVNLITGAVKRMASDRTVGRAEAMRQSMLAMIDKGKTYEAHPKFWAPFVVVGEGAASR